MIKIKYVVGLLGISLLIGFYLGIKYATPKIKSNTNATIMLEKIKEVFNIINVEGQFSEMIHEKSYNYFDLSPFRKSIIIRANAKVLVGYDLDSSKIFVDSKKKEMLIRTHSLPKIISTELNLDYYDIQQGTFNQFSPEELNILQDKIKNLIRTKAESSELFSKSLQRRQELLHTLHEYFTFLGWRLIVQDENGHSSLLD